MLKLSCVYTEQRSNYRLSHHKKVQYDLPGERSPVTDVSTTCAVVIFSCITSVDGIKLLIIDLISQLRRAVMSVVP